MNFFKKEKHQASGMDLGNYDDSQIPVQLKKIMDQLGFLEKKIDTLLEQSRQRQGSRPPFGNRNFSGSKGNYRPNNREGFGPRQAGDNQGNRYEGGRHEGHRPARHGSNSGRHFQKRHTPSHQGTPSHTA